MSWMKPQSEGALEICIELLRRVTSSLPLTILLLEVRKRYLGLRYRCLNRSSGSRMQTFETSTYNRHLCK